MLFPAHLQVTVSKQRGICFPQLQSHRSPDKIAVCIGLSLGYDQSVVLSKSLHHVFWPLLFLCWFFFFSRNVLISLLKISGIKCTGSVSSALLVETLSSRFLFPFFSLSRLCLHCPYPRGIFSQQRCCCPCLWYQQLAQLNLHSSRASAARWEGWEGGYDVCVGGGVGGVVSVKERRKKNKPM